MNVPSKEDLVSKVSDLKAFPFVAKKALDILNNARCSIEDLSSIIEKDQTIAARVLKISNSALYGMRHEVSSLQHALLLLGFKTIKSIVLAATTRSLHKKFGITEKMMWDHSVGAGIASKLISEGYGAEVEEIAFVGGLMHDLGKMMMNNVTPEAFQEVMTTMYNENIDSITAEEEVYGFNHAEIGSKVVAKWKFSPLLTKILLFHHLQDCKIEDAGDASTSVACVHLADNICRMLGIGYRSPDETVVLHELPSASYLKINQSKLDLLTKRIEETYLQERAAFE